MALLTLNQITPGTGFVLAGSAASVGGDAFPCGTDERNFLYIKNGAGSGSITVTIAPNSRTNAKVPGAGTLSIPTEAISVAFGAEMLIGPFPAAYADGAGNVDVTYSSVTSVTVAALRLAPQSF
jgi:hypothetical protein